MKIKEFSMFSEFFLGISILYIVLFGIFLSYNKKYKFPLLQNSVTYLTIIIITYGIFLFLNDILIISDYSNFNNSIINDYLSFSSKILISIISLISLLIIQQYLINQKLNNFEYILIILFAIIGLLLLCSSNDLITSYLSIELQSLSFYLLAGLKKNSTFSVEASLKYFVLGALSSGFFLFGSSLLYGSLGSINFDDFKNLFYLTLPNDKLDLLQLGLIFIFISLFFKLALAPFHIWSPDVYENSPTGSSFFFSIIPKIGIIVLLLRISYNSFYYIIEDWNFIIVTISVFSIIVGSLVGLEQRKLKSLLAYSSISNMGYLLISFISATLEGIQMLISYLIIYIFSGVNIWSILIMTKLKNNYLKKENKDLTDFILLNKSNKILTYVLALALLSIAGLPPLIGFVAKFNIFLVAIGSKMYFVAFISILFTVVATFYYIRILKVLCFEKNLTGKLYYPIKTEKIFLNIILFYLFIFLFLNPTLLYIFSYKISLLILIHF